MTRGIALLVATGLLLVVPAGADAQTASQRAAAQALFDEGVRLSKAGNYDAACLKFEASLAKVDGVGTRGKLAQCYEDAGRIASAWAMWREVGALSGRAGQTQRQQIANDRARSLESRLSYVTIVVAPNARLPGLVVLRDGVRLVAGEFGFPVASDPGTVRVNAEAPGHAPWSQSLELTEGARETIVVPVLDSLSQPEPPPTAVAEPEPEPAPPSTEPTTSTSTDTTTAAPPPATRDGLTDSGGSRGRSAFVVGGLGVGSIATGAVFGALALSDESKADCDDDDVCATQTDADLRESARSKALIADITIGVGVVAVVGAAVLWFTADDGDDDDGTATVVPAIGRDSVGVALSGRF